MATQLFKLAKNNLFFLVNDLKPTYRNEEVTTENVHVINGAASDVSQALDRYDKALEDYVVALREDSSVNSEDDENSVLSCRRFLRLLNAKLAKFAEHCEEKRADTIRVNEEKRADERARLELESRERIEMEKIRLAATAGTMADTATTANTSNLPKINLLTFSGDVTRFQEFWDCFHAAVDCSQPHDVHKFYSDIEIRLKLLENHNCNIEQAMLRDHLLKLVSRPMQNELLKEYGLSVTVRQIRELINKEVRLSIIKEAFQIDPVESSTETCATTVSFDRQYNHPFRDVGNKPYPPVSRSPPSMVNRPCVFCHSDTHVNYDCNEYRWVDERRNRMLDRCYLCLSKSHFFGHCPLRNKVKCYYCKRIGYHNSAICPVQFGREKIVRNLGTSVRDVSSQCNPVNTKNEPTKSTLAIKADQDFPIEESCSVQFECDGNSAQVNHESLCVLLNDSFQHTSPISRENVSERNSEKTFDVSCFDLAAGGLDSISK
ncbi:hypothetical protein WDU94_003513 [Cyamophila willieti]